MGTPVPQSYVSKTALSSRFIAAVALFFVLDLLISFQFHPNRYSLPERSFIWWAVQDYKQLNQAPDVLLFGYVFDAGSSQ